MAMSQHEAAARIESFIRQHFRVPDDDTGFSRDAHLFEAAYVDSAGVVELIMFLESAFRVTLDDEQIFSEAFTSINGIATLLAAAAAVPPAIGAAVR